jgi:osmoprotectant transport system substrate-binding protein
MSFSRRFGRRVAAVLAVGALTTTLAAPQVTAQPAAPSDRQAPVVVGAFDFTESRVLAELYAGALRAAGLPATVRQSTNRERLAPALIAGRVDVVPEYRSTFTEYLNRRANGADAQVVASNRQAATLRAGRALARPLDLRLLVPSKAEDVNAFAVTRAFSTSSVSASKRPR